LILNQYKEENMSNNHRQKVFSVLDSLTQTELDQYIKERNINLQRDKLFEMINKIHKPEKHQEKLTCNINDEFGKIANSYYHLGMAWVISFVLECFYDDKYKIKDLKEYLHMIIKDNQELKEMVYDCMKDW